MPACRDTVMVIVLTAFLLPLTVCAQISPIIFYDYQSGAESESYKSRRLADRFLTIASWAVPASKNELKCKITVAKETEDAVFGATVFRGRELRILLPNSFQAWAHDEESLSMMMSWMLLARAGLRPEYEKYIRDTWFVAGLTRKAAGDTWKIAMPLSKYYPASYALASEGIYPSLRKILGASITAHDLSPRDFHNEYSELLINALARSGLLRDGSIGKILKQTVEEPSINQYSLFMEQLMSPLIQRNRTMFVSSPARSDQEKLADQWFEKELSGELLNYFTPVTASRFKALYREAARWTYLDIDEKRHSCNLRDLVDQWNQIPKANDTVTMLIQRLNELTRFAPPEIHEKLSDLRTALARCRTEHEEKASEELKQAENSLLQALDARLDLELYLKQAEIRCVVPKTRFQSTFEALQENRVREKEMLPEINRLLDEKWDVCK